MGSAEHTVYINILCMRHAAIRAGNEKLAADLDAVLKALEFVYPNLLKQVEAIVSGK
jgi:hypothetical protein